MAAVTAAVVEEFVRNLELSDLTHAIVKEKFRKHLNKDSLTKEEKLQLKRAVEKALLENEEEESSDDDVPLSLTAELLRKQRRRNSAPRPTGEDDQTNDEQPDPMEKTGSRGGSVVRTESPSTDPGDSEEGEEEGVHDEPPPRATEIASRRGRACRPEGPRGSGDEGPLRRRSSGAERESRTAGVSSESDSTGGSDGGPGRCRNGKGPRPAPSRGGGKRREDSEEEDSKEEGDSDARAPASSAAGAQSSAGESSESEGSPSSRGQGQAPRGGSDSSSSSSESEGDAAKVSHSKAKKHSKRKLNEKETRQEEHPTVRRLKRCIAACGVRRNYKKLFADCRSNKARVRVLRQELENLGIKGNPSLEKCRALRFKRDEEAELASLDVANIIHSEGRPRRQRAAAWDLGTSRPQSYKRMLPSDSEDEERPRKLTTWSNLQGLISDDCDSD